MSVHQFPKNGANNSPPTGGDGMEPRIAKLEAGVSHIQETVKEIRTDSREIKKDAKDDFRLIFGAIIAVALALTGIMAKGFKWL